MNGWEGTGTFLTSAKPLVNKLPSPSLGCHNLVDWLENPFFCLFILIPCSALGDGWRAAAIDTQTELKHIHEFLAPIDGAQSFFVKGSTNGGGIGDAIAYYEYRTDLSGTFFNQIFSQT